MLNNQNNHSRQPSTPGSISSGLVTPDYGFHSPYDSNSITGGPEVNESPAGRYDVPASPNELPSGSSYYTAQNNVFSGMYSPSAPIKGCLNPQPVGAMPHVSQGPYQNINQHQIPPQPLPLQNKCLNIPPHQCAGGQVPAASQRSPIPVNVMHHAGVPQPPRADTSGYFGLPASQSNYSHYEYTNSECFICEICMEAVV